MLGFVLSATIIGTQKPTRQTQCALTVAIGVRRLCPAAAASISSIVGGSFPKPDYYVVEAWTCSLIGLPPNLAIGRGRDDRARVE
jgi:hypothetical protein